MKQKCISQTIAIEIESPALSSFELEVERSASSIKMSSSIWNGTLWTFFAGWGAILVWVFYECYIGQAFITAHGL